MKLLLFAMLVIAGIPAWASFGRDKPETAGSLPAPLKLAPDDRAVTAGALCTSIGVRLCHQGKLGRPLLDKDVAASLRAGLSAGRSWQTPPHQGGRR